MITHKQVDYLSVMKKAVSRNFYIKVISSIISLSGNINAYSNAFHYGILECRYLLRNWEELATENSSRPFLKTLQILLKRSHIYST